jgi:hypothetical protein
MTDAGKADILDLEIKKRITGDDKATITALPTPVIKPPPVVSSEPSKATPIPAIGTSLTTPPKAVEPRYASLASLRNNKERNKYFAKATEVLGKREKRILDKMDDPSDKYEWLGEVLSKIAGGTPGAGIGQLAVEAAPEALAGAKELRKDREGLQVKAEDTSLQIGKLGAEQEAADKELEAKVYIALQKDNLDDKERSDLILNYAKATELRSLKGAEIKSMLDAIRDPAARRSLKILLEAEIKGTVGKNKPKTRNTDKAAVAAKVS